MIRPSRFPLCGRNHLGWKSQLHQRKGLYLLPYTQYIDVIETDISIRVDDPGYPTIPTPSPKDPYSDGYLSDLHGRAWTSLNTFSTTDTTRRLAHFFTGYYDHVADLYNNSGYDFRGVTNVISRMDKVSWPMLPYASGVSPQMGGMDQCSYWCWFNGVEPGGSTGSQYIWSLNCQKSRYRYTIDSWGFQAIGDLWANASDDGGTTWRHGYVSPNGMNEWATFLTTKITLENIHLLSTRTGVAPMTWIEVDSLFPTVAYPDTFQHGFLGRCVFSVDFETPAQFMTRTGLTIS